MSFSCSSLFVFVTNTDVSVKKLRMLKKQSIDIYVKNDAQCGSFSS